MVYVQQPAKWVEIRENETKYGVFEIITAVLDFYDVSYENMMSNSKVGEHVQARHVTMYLLRRFIGLKLSAVANIMKKKDHTTVIKGVNKIKNRLKIYPDLKLELDHIISKIRKR